MKKTKNKDLIRRVMKQKISLKNIVTGTLILCILTLLAFLDSQRVHKDFKGLKAKLKEIRMETLTENKPLVVKFNGKIMNVIDKRTKIPTEFIKISTLRNVEYDTTFGIDTIVFQTGVTNAFNKRIHGGEIVLKSWLGFTKHIHINCAGHVREGRNPGAE